MTHLSWIPRPSEPPQVPFGWALGGGVKAEALQVAGMRQSTSEQVSQTSVPAGSQPDPSARCGHQWACAKGPHTSVTRGQLCGRALYLLHLGYGCAPLSSLNMKKQPSRLQVETALVIRIQAGPCPHLSPHTPRLNGHCMPGANPSRGASLHLGSVVYCPQLSGFQIQYLIS